MSVADDLANEISRVLTPSAVDSIFRVPSIRFFNDYSTKYHVGDVVWLRRSKYPHVIEWKDKMDWDIKVRPIGPRSPRVKTINYFAIRNKDEFMTAVHRQRNPKP
jgi:hypothetical protein